MLNLIKLYLNNTPLSPCPIRMSADDLPHPISRAEPPFCSMNPVVSGIVMTSLNWRKWKTWRIHWLPGSLEDSQLFIRTESEIYNPIEIPAVYPIFHFWSGGVRKLLYDSLNHFLMSFELEWWSVETPWARGIIWYTSTWLYLMRWLLTPSFDDYG